MTRMKLMLAVLVLAAMVGLVQQAQAQTLKVVAAGSSALWQTLALGAYNDGVSIVNSSNSTCHYTAGNNFNLVDTRVSTVDPAYVPDNGGTWIVWDYTPGAGISCAAGNTVANNVWAFVKVDSVVGNRCFFAAPKCTLVTNGAFPGVGSKISVWPDGSADQLPPAAVQSIFTSGTLVTAAATDIRPEDAAWAACRVNSPLGASTAGGANSDGLDGLGYSQATATQASGVCPNYISGNAAQNLANGAGNPIISGYPGHSATDLANVLAFHLTGKDPITGTTLPTTYAVTAVGATPVVFLVSRNGGQLTGLRTATEQQLQQVFSGTNCNASAFGLPAATINVFLREPLSGTYNTVEATVMRHPTLYANPVGGGNGSNVEGLSMETGVGANNPLSNTCAGGGGARYRAIGTSEEVNSVLYSDGTNKAGDSYATEQDGIGFAFFSYGNVSPIANNASYGYIQLNGVDPIFASYGAGNAIDPGQPAGVGVLPAEANLPASCGSVWPCNEKNIWGNGFSFPNLRNGTYRAWSLLRLVAATSTNTGALAAASNKYVVSTTPDYVPYNAATVGGTTDLGLKLLRSHYQQRDGAGVNLGKSCPSACLPVYNATATENGGDMGGMIIPTTIGTTTYEQIQLVSSSTPDGGLGPALRH